ncbi:UNVERIFIED_CONTAM: hypothetical protein Sindi_1992200 [Sesamum indicum]
MVTVEDDNAWDDYVKMDSNAKGMCYKIRPFFSSWREIFGKDHAIGDHGADPYKDANDIRNEEMADTQDCYILNTECNPDIGFLGLEEEPTSIQCERRSHANTRLGTLTRVLENEFGDPKHLALVLQHVRDLEAYDENKYLMVANRLVKDPKGNGAFPGFVKRFSGEDGETNACR